MSKRYAVEIKVSSKEKGQLVEIFSGKKPGTRILAEAGRKYILQDPGKSDKAPDSVKIKRVGKNLEITFDDGQDSDLIIENYYEAMPEGYNGLIGQAENGSYYEYLPEDPDPNGLLTMLADGGESVYVVLGGLEVTASGAALAVSPTGVMEPLADRRIGANDH